MLQNKELAHRITESVHIIKKASKLSSFLPLIINFSGGKDSAVLLDLTLKVTKKVVCFFTICGIEFPEAITFAQESSARYGKELVTSSPKDYKGDFFERLAYLGYFPTIKKRWCSRDLKFRPQKKVLTQIYGKANFVKLNGVRRYESSRRNKLYADTESKGFMLPDYDVHGDIRIFPILNWTDDNVREYLEQNKIRIPRNPLYDLYGISGCYWCPFYQKSIYERVIRLQPNLYDRFIEWENKLNSPSVNGFVWLRDIKKESVAVATK